jgi:hypothetical protein
MSVDIALAANDRTTEVLPQRSHYKRRPQTRFLDLVCERCNKRITGGGAGFAGVDVRQADAVTRGLRSGKALWSMWHTACAPEEMTALNPWFLRVWPNRMRTTDALLDVMAELSRLPWFGSTDWGGLVRHILAATDKADEAEKVAAAAERKRRRELRARELAADPDDPRHGTLYGYTGCGCRCERCRAVNRADKYARTQALSRRA